MNKLKTLVVFTIVIFSHPTSALAIFTDRVAWEQAVSGDITLEDFNDSASLFPPVIIDGSVVTLPSGLVLTGSGGGGLAFDQPGNSTYFPSVYIETDFENPTRQLIFSFDSSVLAIGFDYARANYVNSIWVTGIGDMPLSPAPNQGAGSNTAFFGVIADRRLTGLRCRPMPMIKNTISTTFAFIRFLYPLLFGCLYPVYCPSVWFFGRE